MKTENNERRISIRERLATLSELTPAFLGGVHIESDTVGKESRVFVGGVDKVSVLEEERIVLVAGRLRLTFLGTGLFATSYAKGTVSLCGRISSVNAESVWEGV